MMTGHPSPRQAWVVENHPHERGTTMARDYIVATLDIRDEAYGAAMDIDLLEPSVADVKSGVIVQKDMLGNVTQLDSRDLATPWGTIGGVTSGAILGGLIGALAGRVGVAAGAAAGGAAHAALSVAASSTRVIDLV
jgi:uncharacterized membrane protein